MILDGKQIAKEIELKLIKKISTIHSPPCLAVILVGDNPASRIYVKRKSEACKRVGIQSIIKRLPEDISQNELIEIMKNYNLDPEIHGILVQLPLPKQINKTAIIDIINPVKDVDGFHPINLGRLLAGRKDCLISCTPLGIYHLLKHCAIPVEGKNVVIIGRSEIVGKPMAALLMQNWEGANATVTVVHSKTKNLQEHCQKADILIVACGKPNTVTAEMVNEKTVVIDVGINRIDDQTSKKGYRIVGDVDFENVKNTCAMITPVPGGIGPLTIAMLLQNTLTAYGMQTDQVHEL